MQISKRLKSVRKMLAALSVGGGCLLLSAHALAFDVRSNFAPDAPSTDIFRFGFQALKQGRNEVGVEALKYAAEKGHAGSQWKLGRMYAQGDRVERDPREAFRLFAEVADQHADVRPGTKTAGFVAHSFVALGQFYESGSDEAGIRKDKAQARRYYEHAAFYFGDADAQYHLARLHFKDGKLNQREALQATRILYLSAKKGHPRAAARLGTMLMEGKLLKRDVVQGLKFLTIALRRSSPLQRGDIQPLQEQAFSLATDNQRQKAIELADTALAGQK